MTGNNTTLSTIAGGNDTISSIMEEPMTERIHKQDESVNFFPAFKN